jgi:hypothetical protein
MLLEAAALVIVGATIGLLSSTWRIAALISLAGASILWVLLARLIYLSPIPMNEPEWWGGLAITCALAELGSTIGVYLRHRRGDPAAG